MEIRGAVKRETEKAILVRAELFEVTSGEFTIHREVWLPKSQTKVLGEGRFEIPNWLGAAKLEQAAVPPTGQWLFVGDLD